MTGLQPRKTASPDPAKLVQVAPGVYVEPGVRPELPVGRRMHLLSGHGGSASYAALGLTVRQEATLKRLAESGFIKIIWFAPRSGFLDLDSWDRHLAACADDPWYWDDTKRINAYRGAY
jgi:hypothetical protein